MELKQVCQEILDEAKKKDVKGLAEFNKVKMKVLHRLKYGEIPKNATIASLASKKDKEQFKHIFLMKPVRTVSGVSPIALMTDPYPCPHSVKGIGPCTYCPGGPNSGFGDVPQSYTGKEPSTRRAMRNLYDPYLGTMNRIEHYIVMGLVPDKADVIIQGGTFPFTPWIYQEYFVKYLLKAMNDFSILFYTNNELDKNKFNTFFELPADIESEDRTHAIHKKLLFIKNLDLREKDILKQVNDLFFEKAGNNKNSDSNKKNSIKEKNNEDKKSMNNKVKKTINEKESYEDNKENKENKSIINEKNGNKNNENNSKNNDETKSIIEQWNQFSIQENLEYEKQYKTESDSEESNKDANLRIMKLVRDKANLYNKDLFSLEEMQHDNETAKIRCIGLTIETKSDYGKLLHGNQMLKLGCTRVELGIQSIYDEVLEKTQRGNTVQDNIESIRILKDLAFKINSHYMPGLPLTTYEMDRKGLRALFEDPNYKPDMLKVYPAMVMKGTQMFEEWKKGDFKPLTTEKAAELIAEMFSYVPEYARVMRVQRDIPTYATESGVDKTNLRQYVEKVMKDKGIKSRDIRAREAGMNAITNKKIDINNATIRVTEYEASNGTEFFIQAEDKEQDVLFGFIRMRFPSEILREEITEKSALIRELHVYSSAVAVGEKDETSFQHKGIGKKLLKKAEEIAKKHSKGKMLIISGIGVREYFRKFGYELEGPYMSKVLSK